MNCFNCNSQCNRLCPNFIISDSVSVVTVDGTDTLLIDIPSGSYVNRGTYCIIVAQNRPTTATVDMPVAISIGGDTTTVYPLVCNRTCLQATACQIIGRSRIRVIVQTGVTTGVFRAFSGLGSCCSSMLTSLPVTTTTTTTTTATTTATDTTATTTNATATTLAANEATTLADTTTTRKVGRPRKEEVTEDA